MNKIILPDVSFYQDNNATARMIDFEAMRLQSFGVFIRAGQNAWVDQDLAENMKRAKEAGLLRGTYWFYDSRVHPVKQAELYISALKGDLGELPLVADFEERYNGPYKGWKYWYDFLTALQRLAPGKRIMIYTAYYYWVEFAPSAIFNKASLDWFGQFPLWIAGYNTPEPKVPEPWKAQGWEFWQYTDNGDGALYGVESKNIDLNYFRGGMDEFLLKYGVPVTPPPTTPPVVEGVTKARHVIEVRAESGLEIIVDGKSIL